MEPNVFKGFRHKKLGLAIMLNVKGGEGVPGWSFIALYILLAVAFGLYVCQDKWHK